MKTVEILDYLSVTFLSSDFHYPVGLFNMKINPDGKPLYGYDTQWDGDFGVKAYSSSTRKDMGLHVVMSGKVLQRIRAEDFDVYKEITDHCWNIAHNVSRVDVCVDIHGCKFTPHDIHNWHLSGACKTRMKKSNFIGSGDEIETFYVGSQKSRTRLFRAYNKAVEMGLAAWVGNYTRVELQTNKNARGVMAMIADGASYAGIIRKYVDFPDVDEWIEAMESEPVHIKHDPPDEPDTAAWILRTLPKPLARVMHDLANRPDGEKTFDDFMNTLMGRTLREYEKLHDGEN